MNNIKLLLNLNPDVNSKMEFSEAVSYGGFMVLVGMVTIFAVLGIIWLALLVFKYFCHDLANKKSAAPTVNKAPEPQQTVTSTSQDEEIVAAIAAAIAMAESESDGIKFRVVSFKRR